MTTHGPSEVLRARAMELTALAESGLAYSRDEFDIARFHRVGELARELMQEVAADPLPEYDREVASATGYATPKIDLRAGIFDRDGRVLLVREIADAGRWTLPGGWCDIHESPRAAIEREVLEEAGVRARAVHLAAVVDRERWGHVPVYDRHIYKLFFVCEVDGPVNLDFASVETSEVGWFDVDDLPDLSVARVLPEQIALLRAQWRDPGPAYVD